MRLPRFTNTLHFRLSALFLLLLGISAGGYWLWVDATILSPYGADDEKDWYENRAEGQLDTLAVELGRTSDRPAQLAELLVEYGQSIGRFDAEVIVFGPGGENLASCRPDSLDLFLPQTDPELLADMSDGEWDFGSYPVPDNMDAYENRIFEVDRVYARGDSTAELVGYLTTNFRPVTMGIEEYEGATGALGFRAVLMGLVYAALSGLIVLAWTSRRIRHLSEGVDAIAQGKLDTRVNAGSRDEIGALGRHVNTMADRIQEMLAQLQRNEQFQRQLIANVSHDLRTPLASLRGYVETLSLDAGKMEPARREHYLSIITANLDHLDRMLENTLLLSRIDSGQTTLRREEFPVAELADEVLARCRALADNRHVGLTLETEPDVPLVNADPLQIARVLQNLVENGIKFNRTGGHVVVDLTKADGQVRIAVRDDGPGIDAEDLPHIFDRFYTGNKSRTRAEAATAGASLGDPLDQCSGLGLAIAAKIVAGHGGVLDVRSEKDSGTTFSFTLPAAQAERRMAAEA